MQLREGFGFDAAAELVPYLARLGISDLYLSPILQAAPGSTHGYDVVDHGRLSDDLGGATSFAHLARTAAAHDLAVVVDVVPNHMALAGAANRWWWDVLEDGPSSRFADHFDIDWSVPHDGHRATVLMPILGDHFGRVLEAGDLHLSREGGAFFVRYAEHELPISLRTLAPLLHAVAARTDSVELADVADRLAALPSSAPTDPTLRQELRELAATHATLADALDEQLAALAADPDALEALLAEQHYRIAYWRVASEELHYRRFFDITTLVGLRVEAEGVFEDTHRLVVDLVADGAVGGLRIDHVDGLRDPKAYLERLRAAAPDAWIVVEKILADEEELPAEWPVDGTTGYDFARAVGDLFVDPDGLRTLEAHHADFTGETGTFADVAHAAQIDVLERELAAEVERVTELLQQVCHARRRHRDHTRRELRTLVRELAAAMPVYRTYVREREPTRDVDRQRIAFAIAEVRRWVPETDDELLALLERALVLDEEGDDVRELALRFQQLSSTAMAKGIEDTAFYRWAPFVAANEVGGDPAAAGRGVKAFHLHNQAVVGRWPATMLALSTHDTKRSADVRARLAGLSEVADQWTATVDRWRDRHAPHRGDWDDPPMELLLYQSIVGAWPIDADRVEASITKAANEAKVHTSWALQDESYLDGLRHFVRALYDGELASELESFLAETDLVALGRTVSLAQLTLELTSPGVPDTYQGDEIWALRLVDPDNRAPVDFDRRAALLEDIATLDAPAALERADEGAPKLWLLHRLLQHRRTRPECYASATYEPLSGDGPRAEHVVAFARDGLVVVVPRLLRGVAGGWCGTSLALPPGRWSDVLGSASERQGDVLVADLLDPFPVAVLERADG